MQTKTVKKPRPELGKTVRYTDKNGQTEKAEVRAVWNDEVVDLETEQYGPYGITQTETHEKVMQGAGPNRWDFDPEETAPGT